MGFVFRRASKTTALFPAREAGVNIDCRHGARLEGTIVSTSQIIVWGAVVVLLMLGPLRVLNLVIAWIERIPVRTYSPWPDGRPPPPALVEVEEEARALGLLFESRCSAGAYEVCASFWRIPGCDAYAVISRGRIARLPFSATRLFSHLQGGQTVLTSDFLGDGDISGTRLVELHPGRGLAELVERHRDRLRDAHTAPVEGCAATAEAANVVRVDAMKQRGYVRRRGADGQSYSYTTKGTLKRLSLGKRMAQEIQSNGHSNAT